MHDSSEGRQCLSELLLLSRVQAALATAFARTARCALALCQAPALAHCSASALASSALVLNQASALARSALAGYQAPALARSALVLRQASAPACCAVVLLQAPASARSALARYQSAGLCMINARSTPRTTLGPFTDQCVEPQLRTRRWVELGLLFCFKVV
jgi:hypothetical protein